MSRVHDMGGRFGDGAVVPEAEDAPLFEEEWHARALAITLACGALGHWNIDISRHAREKLAPRDYAKFTYYEKWTAALADLLVETDLLSTDEFLAGAAKGKSPMAGRVWKAEAVAEGLARGAPADRQSDIPAQFKSGDPVQTRAAGNLLVDGGHTRLPGYAAKAKGYVVRLHGTHVLPDSAAHRLGDAAQPLYAVAFKASELWHAPEDPDDEVVLDLWQSYLMPL